MHITTLAPTTLLSINTFTATVAIAQPAPLEIQYTAPAELTVNSLVLEGTTVEKLIGSMGKPSRTEGHPSGETSYFYDESGVVFFTSQRCYTRIGNKLQLGWR